MRDEWIAVARGLKCLSISIKASMVAFGCAVFTPVSIIIVLANRGVCAAPLWLMLIVPSGIAAVVAIVYSRVARVFLLKVTSNIPEARFCVIASFVLELIGQTGLGAYIAIRALGIPIAGGIETWWIVISFIAGFIGWLYFQYSLHKIAIYTICADADDRLGGVRVLVIMGFAPIALGCLIGYVARDPMILLISAVMFAVALIFFVIALALYSRAVRSLRFSALRQAVRCGDRGENRG